VALELLRRAAEGRQRLEERRDDTALHDFRVAVRRLRSWLRAFRPTLDARVRRKVHRRLRAIARSSSGGRDAEVQLEWLEAQQSLVGPGARAGLDWVRSRIEERRAGRDARFRRRVERRFTSVENELEESLASPAAQAEDTRDDALEAPALPADAPPNGAHARAEASFGVVVASLLRRQARDLRTELGRVRSAADEQASHASRIAVKRLRYLVEPLAGVVDGAEPLVDRLRGLQDSLGELHDAHTLLQRLARLVRIACKERARRLARVIASMSADYDRTEAAARLDPEPVIMALADLLRQRVARAFNDVAAQALGGKAEPMLTAVERLADRVEVLGSAPRVARGRLRARDAAEVERHAQ